MANENTVRTDRNAHYVVIGSGIAGLTYALKVARQYPLRQVLVLTKAETENTNTGLAQGGIAAVLNSVTDSFESHIEDTLSAGDGLCNREIVNLVVLEAPMRIHELLNWGASFDKGEDGNLHFAREGGHTRSRVVHCKDETGKEVERTLIQQAREQENITIATHLFVTELLVDSGKCYGLRCLNTGSGEVENIAAGAVVLAAGGAGQLYPVTTNPQIATGDGIALALRAGALLENMEFVQFHPTALYGEETSPAFLISEAVRGAGAELLNADYQPFMLRYDARGSLAPRDIVSRAITEEMQHSGKPHVWLDCSSIPAKKFTEEFPAIQQKCNELGLDLAHEPIPVVPAAHYFCGGIKVDMYGRTGIKGLFAIGENACTGLHGANRLASNSLLEALVFAHSAALATSEADIPELPAHFAAVTVPQKKFTNLQWLQAQKQQLQAIMQKNCGIVRNFEGLAEVLTLTTQMAWELQELRLSHHPQQELEELANMALVGQYVARAAAEQKKNYGLHFNTDIHNAELQSYRKKDEVFA